MAEIVFAEAEVSAISPDRDRLTKNASGQYVPASPNPAQDLGTVLKPSRNLKFATGVPFWGDQPESWDTVRIDGITIPGVVRLEGSVGQRWETREVPGQNGAKITRLGYEAAKVSIRILMATEEHLRAFEKLVPLIRPKASDKKETIVTGSLKTGKTSRERRPEDAFNVEHPALALYGMKTFICERAGLPEQKGDSSGMYEVKLELLEYVNQEKVGTTSGVSKTTRAFNGKLSDLGPGRLQANKGPAKPSTTNGGTTT